MSVVLAGCVSFGSPAPEIHTYSLAYEAPAATGAPLDVILRIPPFAVAAVYDREAMIYRSDAYSTGNYYYDRWSANPGSMIADLLARDFAASRLYRDVQQSAALVPSDYQLEGTIEEIDEQATGKTCAARLRLRIAAIRSRGIGIKPVLLQSSFAGEEPCPCNSPPALAAAMSKVLGGISLQLQEEVRKAITVDTENRKH